MGLMMQGFVVAAQKAAPLRAIGSTTALLQFARPIGATFGATLFGVIVNRRSFGDGGLAPLAHPLSLVDRRQLAAGLHDVFLLALCLGAIVLVAVVLGLKEHPLRRGFDEPAVLDGPLLRS